MDTVKTSPVAKLKNFAAKHERKILVTTTVVSTTAAVLMRSNVAAHNEFLKQHGLYDTFYTISTEA